MTPTDNRVTPAMLLDAAGWCQSEDELRETLRLAAKALSAALAVEAEAGADADVEALYFTDQTLPILAISGEAECNNVIRLHYRRPVSNADRDSVVEALNSALTPASSGVEGEAVALTYTNWRGETSVRSILPKRVWFGATEWHPEPQWLLTAFDIEKQAERDFALKDFGPAPTPAGEWPLEDLTRPIFGIENRTAQEVFDIMADRIRLASPAPHQEGR